MRRLYPNVEADTRVPHPWFVKGPEGETEVENRIRPFLEKLFRKELEEALLVGHGASTYGCLSLLVRDHISDTEQQVTLQNWNCSLSTVEADGRENASLVRLFDILHMPLDSVTSNRTYYQQADD